MAKITRLASTLIARYYPSKTLTDAFYMDGRLFGKRESRNADITIDKEERGFFFSVFSHPTIPGYEPGMVPPYEPQLRAICNEVKFGRKPIDEMISGFLTSAVDITGKMKLQDQDNRAPYFSGIIVHDAEAFAVTIGNGLAFLYRNDTLYPLTDAGIPMEPIDAFGNRVGDFYNYVSSKTANALWSNITTLSVDDCIILCNKAVYDALGQREILRILDEAEDQCDAAGTVITQAAANMPNAPMQFSISFVENITADEKKGFFSKFGKKNKEEDMENMSIKSTFEGGIIGAAAGSVAAAGFTTGVDAAAVTAAAETEAAIDFGDTVISAGKAIADTEISDAKIEDLFDLSKPAETSKTQKGVEFLDSSVDVAPPKEVTAEEMMKTLFGEMEASKTEAKNIQKKAEEDAKAIPPLVIDEPTPSKAIVEGTSFAPQTSEIPSDSPFVSAFNPFAASAPVEEEMETVAEVPFESAKDDSMMDTKTVSTFDSLFAQQVQSGAGIANNGIIAAALREMQEENKPESEEVKEEPKAEENKAEEPKAEEVKVEEDKTEEPKVEEKEEITEYKSVLPAFSFETAKKDEVKVVEAPKTEEAKAEEEVKFVIPAVEEVKAEETKAEEPKIEEPKVEVKEEIKETVIPEVKDFVIGDATSAAEDIEIPSFTIDAQPAVQSDNGEITFNAGETVLEFGDSKVTSAPFNPYEIGSVDDVDAMPVQPVMFPGQESGDFNVVTDNAGGETVVEDNENHIDEPTFEWEEKGIPTEQIESDVPAPQFVIDPNETATNPVENVSFPVSTAPNAEPDVPVVPAVAEPIEEVTEAPVEIASEEAPANDGYVLPFETAVYAEPEPEVQAKDIPDMPLYGSQAYDAPTYAVNSEQPLDDVSTQAYSVGEYTYNEDMAVEPAPYQTYGNETIDDGVIDPAPVYEQPVAPEAYQQQYNYDPNYDPNAQAMYQAQQEAYAQQQEAAYAQQAYEQQAQAYAYEQAQTDAAAQQNVSYDQQSYAQAPVDSLGNDALPTADDEWVNNILGIGTDENGEMSMNYIDPNVDMSKGTPRPQTARPGNKPNARPGAPKKPGTPSGRPNPNRPSNKKKKFKLSRNGIIFLAFVAVLFISLILIISLIIKSCSKSETKVKTPAETSAPVESVVETTKPQTPAEPDPTAPVGVFVFSEYTGYRTWYDLFQTAYGIQIENTSDPRIKIICDYNGAAEGYVPASGDSLLLPPVGVLNGTVSTGETTETEAPEATDAEGGSVEGTPAIQE